MLPECCRNVAGIRRFFFYTSLPEFETEKSHFHAAGPCRNQESRLLDLFIPPVALFELASNSMRPAAALRELVGA